MGLTFVPSYKIPVNRFGKRSKKPKRPKKLRKSRTRRRSCR